MPPTTVARYRPEWRTAFEALNRQWIQQYFTLEAPDLAAFRDPDREIRASGGEIFFVLDGDRVVGTCAMVRHGADVFELAKMGVAPEWRKQGCGALLMEAAIAFAREQGALRIELLTNATLQPALRLYERYGFRQVPVAEREGGYARADVKMVLELPSGPVHT